MEKQSIETGDKALVHTAFQQVKGHGGATSSAGLGKQRPAALHAVLNSLDTPESSADEKVKTKILKQKLTLQGPDNGTEAKDESGKK